jgi:hypothetical protein
MKAQSGACGGAKVQSFKVQRLAIMTRDQIKAKASSNRSRRLP